MDPVPQAHAHGIRSRLPSGVFSSHSSIDLNSWLPVVRDEMFLFLTDVCLNSTTKKGYDKTCAVLN